MVAANYQRCLQEVLKHEGGYVDHPRDPGGETNYGITLKVARAHGYEGPMRSIPMSLVESIYRRSYWNAVGGNTLAPGVDLATFDFGVNSGPARAKQYLARVVGGPDVDTVKKLCAARLSFVKALGTWGTFGRGWARRIASVEALGVKMALVAAGKPSAEVRKELDKESKGAAEQKKKDVIKGGGTAAGGGGADWLAVDWGAVAGWVVAIVVVLGVVYFVRRAIINHERAKAYDAEALKGGLVA